MALKTSSPSSPSSLWSTTTSTAITKALKAGNYVVALNTSKDIVLIDVLTGVSYTPVFNHLSSPDYMGYDDGILVFVDYDNNDNYRISAYSLQEIIAVCNTNSPSSPTPLWEVKQSSNEILPNDASLNIISNEVYSGIFTAVFSVQHTSLDFYMAALDLQTGLPVWNKNSEVVNYIQIETPIAPPTTKAIKTEQLFDSVNPAITRPPVVKSTGESVSPYTCVGDGSFFLIVNGQLFAYNRSFGDLRFPKAAGVAIDPPAVTLLSDTDRFVCANKTIIATGQLNQDQGNSVVALSADIGKLQWSYPAVSSTTKWRIAALSDDETLVALYSTSGMVQVVQVASGKPMWSSDIQLTGITAIDQVQALLAPSELQILPEGSDSVFILDLTTSTPTPEQNPFNQGTTDFSPLMIDGSVVTCEEATTGGGYTVVAQVIAEGSDAAYFDGTSNSISFTLTDQSLDFGTNDYTIECWMRSATGGEVFSTTTSGAVTLKLNVNLNGQIAIATTDSATVGGGYVAAITGNTTATDGQWHHIAVVKDAGNYHFYLDTILVSNEKVQRLPDGSKYFNDHYQLSTFVPISSPTNPATPPKNKLEQLPINTPLPADISIDSQTGFTISPANATLPYVGLLRELRIWQNAVSSELICSRMNKVLGPNRAGGGTSGKVKGKEPKLVVNVHMGSNEGRFPQQLINGTGSVPNNTTMLNDVDPNSSVFGTFTNPCSCPTDLLLELDGFPYLLDKSQVQWPFEEHWAVRAEKQVTTNAVMSSSGVICFGANNYVYGIRKNDGKALWNVSLDTGFSNPINTDMGFMLLSDGQVLLINPKTGELVSMASGAKSYASLTGFEANQSLAAFGDYIVFANDAGGVSYMKDIGGTVNPITGKTIPTNEAKNIQLIGTTVYWCDDTNSTYTLLGYDLETESVVFSLPVTSDNFAVNTQYLYALTSAGLTVYSASTGDQVGASMSAITSLSGIVLAESGNQLVITQNGNSTTDGTLMTLKPATLSVTWSVSLGKEAINPPVIEGQNVFCTYGTTVAAYNLSTGAEMGIFTVENQIISSPLMDQTTAFFACVDGAAGTEIDGALHQVVFGDTTVLQFNGSNYVELTNTDTTNAIVENLSNTIQPGNCCVEAWVNVNDDSSEMGMLSLSANDGSNTTQLALYLDAHQQINFVGSAVSGAVTTTITAISDVAGLVPQQQWCHIAVNIQTNGTTATAKLYVNGKPCNITTTTTTSAITSASGVMAYIGATGATNTATPVASNSFNGLIGYVRVWNAYQTITQLMDRMHTQLVGTEADLMIDWNFDTLTIADGSQNISVANGFTIELQAANGSTVPNYLLNQLNLARPNYPYLTYQGENNGDVTDAAGTTYDAYILKITAHKPDGSPLENESLTMWYTDGGNGSDLYLETTDGVFAPSPQTKYTLTHSESLSDPANCLVLTTDTTGCATVYVYVNKATSVSGPGFDLYAPFLPHHERFHVNAIINRQRLEMAPPPTVNAQAELIVDYHYETGGKIDTNRQKSVYRTLLRTENPDKSPRAGELVTVYADSPQTITVDGTTYHITKKNGATLYTDGTGELMIDSDATDAKGYLLEIWTGFMHRNDRVKFSVSEGPHKRLKQVTGDDLNSNYTTGWTGIGENTSASPLLKAQYATQSQTVADSFHHLMAAAHPKPAGGSSPGDGALLTDNAVAKATASHPIAQQPTGFAMPDKVYALRTLTYIDRTKTMDFDALKTSIQTAATTGTNNVPNAQGLKMTTIGTGATKTYELVYLTAADVQKARAGGVGSTAPLSEIVLGGFFGDVFHDIENLAADAAKAFTDLVHDAESLVLDLTNDVEAAICGVLNDLGPLGHLLADGLEKVMSVVDKIIHFIDVLINDMLDFLLLFFEWEHIVATHKLLKNGLVSPGLEYLNTTFLPKGNFMTTLTNGLAGMTPPQLSGSSDMLNHSAGDVKSKYGSKGYGAKAHGVKSKTLINKTKSNAGGARSAKPSNIPAPTPVPAAGSQTSNIVTSAFTQLSSFNFKGSLDPLSTIINAIGTQISDASSGTGTNAKTGMAAIMADLAAPLEALVPSNLFSAMYDVLKQEIDIPFISALYEFITGDQLTLIDLFSLLAAVPTFLIYEVLTNGDFFDVVYSGGLPITIPSGTNQTEDHSGLLGDTTTPKLPTHEEITAPTYTLLVASELMIILDLIVDYMNYQQLQDSGTSSDPAVSILSGISGMTSMLKAFSLWNIQSFNLSEALVYAGTENNHPFLTAYGNKLKTFSDVMLGVSLVASVAGMLKVEKLLEKIPKPGSKGKIILAVVALLGAIYPIYYLVEEYKKIINDIGSSDNFNQALRKRIDLYIASSGVNSAYLLVLGLKLFLKSEKMPQAYMASGVVAALLAEATTILVCVEELEYGVQNTQS